MMNSHPSLAGVTVLIMILCVGISGCETTSPLSAIPSVIYFHAGNETRIYVTGEENMYVGINITIDNVSKVENYTYGLLGNTSLARFQLEVRVYDVEGDKEDPTYQWYTYSASVRIVNEEDELNFKIIDHHNEKEVTKTTPYKTVMEKIQ
jgi:hypothetical protein